MHTTIGVQSAETACERCTVRCTVTKRRGRPPGIKETKPRKRASGVGSEDVKNQMQLVRLHPHIPYTRLISHDPSRVYCEAVV